MMFGAVQGLLHRLEILRVLSYPWWKHGSLILLLDDSCSEKKKKGGWAVTHTDN